MAERMKMSRVDRAKQFMPFDALKGLQEALRLKEYEHEKSLKNELSEEQIMKISETLRTMENNDLIEVKIFDDGYFKVIQGRVKKEIEFEHIFVDGREIVFDVIQDIRVL